MKKIIILGSTGSIGQNALKVLSNFKDEFKVVGLVAGKNIDLLIKQIKEFNVKNVGIKDKRDLVYLKKIFPKVNFFGGEEEISKMVEEVKADLVVGAIVGFAGLMPCYKALESGKDLALANKEALVMAGNFFKKISKEKKKKIIPIDSEHSALHQALRAGKKNEVRRLILTASGGPFLNLDLKEFNKIKVEDALKHPTWIMGKKITIDSATLANKGLEVIEAHFLFDFPPEKIDVVIHPQSIIHSLVEYVDGFIISQLSINDMKYPIQYALTYPKRLKTPFKYLNLYNLNLSFFEPDFKKFPMLPLAYEALKEKKGLPAIYSLSNEISVYNFLEGKIKFMDIPKIVEDSMEKFYDFNPNSLEEIISKEKELRSKINEMVLKRRKK